MRLSLALVLVACGGPATPPVTPVTPTIDAKQGPIIEEPNKQTFDPIAVLTPPESDDQPVSWLSPGGIQLELGGPGIESPGGNRPIEVVIVDHQGNQVRAVVRLEHARFSLWSDRARMFAVLAHEQKINTFVGAMPMDDMFVKLEGGARVKRLQHKGSQTQIRYVGALEVEGWVDDTALGDTGEAGHHAVPMPTSRRKLLVTPGAVIRSKPEWGQNELALVAGGYLLDIVTEDAMTGWSEVAYADNDIAVHGYTSRMSPPGRVHRLQDPDAPPPVITANAKAASGTCLYTKTQGEAIGYIVGDRDVQLDDRGNGWWSLAVDTPWGPIPFGAKGADKDSLVRCAPASDATVPPPATTP